MSINLVSSFPYAEPRVIQKEALEVLGEQWDSYDVFVINAPTAFGKTALARTLMNSLRSVSVITPTNQLVEQFQGEFPDTATLSRMDSYKCDEWQRPCQSTRSKLLKYCAGCKCGKDISVAKFRKGPGVYNYHIYASHKIYRDVLVIDEAHNTLPFIRERMAIRLWQHDFKYPTNMFTPEQVREWIASLPPNKQKNKKIQLLREAAAYLCPTHIFQRTKDWFNGKGTLRNEPEERDLIKLYPVDISSAPPILWPGEVRKLILMSATIGPKDVEQLGLGRRKVLYIDCASPISPGVRPIIPLTKVSVNRSSSDADYQLLANEINNIAEFHGNEKGVVHASYSLSGTLRALLPGGRFMFHNRENKKDVYRRFRDSPPDEGRVLVACGMYEGIDLPEDLGRWQVISKIPWQSLANPAIRHLAELDPEWYLWETWKTTIQACGRICRTPEDYGVSYILDRSFWRLFNDGGYMIPSWFRDALQMPTDK